MNKGDFPDDTFTESEVLSALEGAGLKYRNGSRYILAQCPTHDDVHPSVQIYKDDWFVNCHSGCGRYHITKAFPVLRQNGSGQSSSYAARPRSESKGKVDSMTEHKYISVDLMDFWKSLLEIPADHVFKGIDIDNLNSMGWRYDEENERYFIPYFSRSQTTIPFAQWRNLRDGPRFNFWKDTKPTMYGTWNLDPSQPVFLVEGASDAAVLDFCAIPWIAAPSAASGELVKKMAMFCKENDIQVIYAGDNDEAGDKLKEALDSVMSYRIKQPPKKYKDWGDFFEAEGFEAVNNYCNEELYPPDPARFGEPVELNPDDEQTFVLSVDKSETATDSNANIFDTIDKIFPGAEKLEDPRESKEQSKGSSSVLY